MMRLLKDIKMKKYNLVCFGYFPWGTMWKRNQSMMAQISKFSYIQNLIFVNPEQNIRKRFSNKTTTNLLPSKISNGLWVYSPYRIFPFKKQLPSLQRVEDKFYYTILKWLIRGKPYILFMNNPIKTNDYMQDRLLADASLSIFDLSDDFVEYFNDANDHKRKRCLGNLNKYAGAADMVLAVNEHVKTKYSYLNAQIQVIRNATNYDNFNRKTYDGVTFLDELALNNTTVAGYSGGIRENRIDFNLLDFILQSKKTWKFIFIGEADKAFKQRFLKYSNVYLFPPVDYTTLPDCLNYIDLAIVPFKICEHTKGNDLLKYHDYLAMGKPVVSTDIAGAQDLADVISIAHTHQEFTQKMDQELQNNSPETVQKRKATAFNNSWPKRMKAFEAILLERLSVIPN